MPKKFIKFESIPQSADDDRQTFSMARECATRWGSVELALRMRHKEKKSATRLKSAP